MISVLIPVYNWNIRPLVSELNKQLQIENIPFEIIIEDDASEERYHLSNYTITDLPHTTYIRNEQNCGRSKIRNSIIKKANFQYILLMDCDAGIVSPEYIKNYITRIKQLPEDQNFIISGGVAYRPEKPAKEYLLRWKYGQKKEEISAEKRATHPYKSFTPFNIAATRSLFMTIPFDENFHSYGHEDTLFGFQLSERGVPIYHIDNPLYHDGLDNNTVYLQKVRSSVENLAKFSQIPNIPPFLFQEIRLYRFYYKIRKMGLLPLFRMTFSSFKKVIINNILIRNNLFLLDLYKLYLLDEYVAR